MKCPKTKLSVLLLSIFVLGCSLITELTKDGIGQPIATVIERYGRPTRVTSDGSDGSIYIWEQWFDRSYGRLDLWSTMYWVDSKGIIYKWR